VIRVLSGNRGRQGYSKGQHSRAIHAGELKAGRLYSTTSQRYAGVKIAEGVPVTMVAAQLGHSRKSLTLDTYSHVLAG
jgi:hypothetical protein